MEAKIHGPMHNDPQRCKIAINMYIKNEASHVYNVGNIMFALFVVKSPLGAAVPALLGYVTYFFTIVLSGLHIPTIQPMKIIKNPWFYGFTL